jgi:hypothetical protein
VEFLPIVVISGGPQLVLEDLSVATIEAANEAEAQICWSMSTHTWAASAALTLEDVLASYLPRRLPGSYSFYFGP